MTVVWRHGPSLPASMPWTLAELLEGACRAHPRVPLLTCEGRTWTWDDLLPAAGRLAQHWRGLLAPGDRLAIVLPNGPAHLLAELAAWRLGAVAMPLPAAMGPARLAAALRRFAARALVAEGPLPGTTVPLTTPAALLNLAAAPGPQAPWAAAGRDTPCLLLATSGSSGQPRGVLLSHGNLASQQAAYAALWPEVGPGDRLASYLPWHHSFGGLAERLWALCRGLHLTVVPGGGRDHPAFLATLAAVRPTLFLSVPRMHRVAILGGGAHLRGLRWAFTAGAALAAPEEAWYAAHGIPLYEGWGLTETSPTATITRAGAPRLPGLVGEPVAGVAVGVRDDGRLLVAGPGVMLGYAEDDAANACLGSFPAAGAEVGVGRWIDSGDLGAWTAHGLELKGRSDLTIKLANGEKVALGGLATALEAQPGVRAALALCRDGETIEALLAPLPGAGERELAAAAAAVNAVEVVPFRRFTRAWRLVPEPTCANGLLTASLKVARGGWLAALHRQEVLPLALPAAAIAALLRADAAVSVETAVSAERAP